MIFLAVIQMHIGILINKKNMDKRTIWEGIPEEAKQSIIRGIRADNNVIIKIHQNFGDRLLNTKRPSSTDLDLIFNAESLMLGGSEISSIEFVKYFKNTKSIYLWGTKVTDISSLSHLPLLECIYASGAKLISYEPLKNSRIKLLYNSYSAASDYFNLSNILTLEKLELGENEQLTSVEPFKNLVNLEMLHIPHTRVTSLRPLIELKKLQELFIIMTPIPESEIVFFDSYNKSNTKAQNWL